VAGKPDLTNICAASRRRGKSVCARHRVLCRHLRPPKPDARFRV